ncbi:Gag Polyprotein [Phytophthora cinnamomi]|uniref:Gag Polyprotein n=1 Tax=Phytophthora cinnamomi TaxID=4785 RepID=UPI00355A485F|nr:Gag Polyprotein [Phytophthora cinnamomi]
MTRVMGYWSNFRGNGDPDNADLGFSLWERDQWNLPKAVETTFAAVAADLERMDWTPARKTRTRKDLDTLKAAWAKYVVERNKRSDRLRAKVVPYIWKWGSSKDPDFSEVNPEFMFEPTMPGYSLEYLPWEPKTVEWLNEIAALDAVEPWRNRWVDVPEQHPYNTTFVPCNPLDPLFVPVGSSRVDVGRRVILSSSL